MTDRHSGAIENPPNTACHGAATDAAHHDRAWWRLEARRNGSDWRASWARAAKAAPYRLLCHEATETERDRNGHAAGRAMSTDNSVLRQTGDRHSSFRRCGRKCRRAILRDDQSKRTISMKNGIVIKEPNAPAVSYENPWLEAAAESGNERGKLLKFVKGKYGTGDDVVPEGTEYVAHINQLVRGWSKFEDSKIVEQHLGKVADGFKVPARSDLSDTDPKKWNKDSDGEPRDPWVLQWYLPLVGVESGELITFVTGSKGGIEAIGTLCRVYGRKHRDGLLPIVALGVRSYKHKKYGRIENPDLAIVGWDGEPTAPPTQPRIGDAAGDLNDQIPF
jgi:hypothetical protein